MQEEIRCMKNEKFKNIVLKKIKILAKEYFISLRGPKSVKLKHVNSLKDYLKCERLTLEEKKLLFASKTRSVNVKTSFRKMYSKTNMFWRLCKSEEEEESEIHILKCKNVIKL